MTTQYAPRYRWLILAVAMTLGATGLSAQHLLLSVNSRAGAQCGPAIAGMLDQQGTETRLRDAGFQITKARNAILSHEVNCTVTQKTTAIQQCLQLSELLAVPSQSRAVQLATQWRECKQYSCAGAACGNAIHAGLSGLESLFIDNFRRTSNPPADPAPTSAADVPAPRVTTSATARLAGIRTHGVSLYYLSYILACFLVMFRWEIRRHAR